MFLDFAENPSPCPARDNAELVLWEKLRRYELGQRFHKVRRSPVKRPHKLKIAARGFPPSGVLMNSRVHRQPFHLLFNVCVAQSIMAQYGGTCDKTGM